MIPMDVEADLTEIQKPIPSAPFTSERLEQLFTSSHLLKMQGIMFEKANNQVWQLTYKNKTYAVTFYPQVLDEMPALQLMSFGNPIFEDILNLNSH